MKIEKLRSIVFVLIAIAGLADTSYLAAKHFSGGAVNCSILSGCDKVLASPYAVVGGSIPLALLGAAYYLALLILALIYLQSKNKSAARLLLGLSAAGFVFSLWLVYLQFFVIRALCVYCLGSALATTLLFSLAAVNYANIYENRKSGVSK